MSTRGMPVAAMALALAIAACRPPAPPAGPLSDEDVAAIGGVRDAYVPATLGRDFAAVAALYEENGLRMPPNEPLNQGRAAIQAALEAEPGTVTELTVTSLGTEGVEGLA